MLIVPLSAVPSQTLTIVLNNQNCVIAVYQKSTGVYMDLTVNGSVLFTTVACLNNDPIVRGAYLGFIGELAFVDQQGAQDPYYTGFGTRYLLTYYDPSEL